VIFLVASIAAYGDRAGAQVQQRPPQPTHSPAANICFTQGGWCNLPILQTVNTQCVCLTAANQQVPGVARWFSTNLPPSPYLRPHTTPSK
jgi:hypothetical protein